MMRRPVHYRYKGAPEEWIDIFDRLCWDVTNAFTAKVLWAGPCSLLGVETIIDDSPDSELYYAENYPITRLTGGGSGEIFDTALILSKSDNVWPANALGLDLEKPPTYWQVMLSNDAIIPDHVIDTLKREIGFDFYRCQWNGCTGYYSELEY